MDRTESQRYWTASQRGCTYTVGGSEQESLFREQPGKDREQEILDSEPEIWAEGRRGCTVYSEQDSLSREQLGKRDWTASRRGGQRPGEAVHCTVSRSRSRRGSTINS
jgi:hypothetical protein